MRWNPFFQESPAGIEGIPSRVASPRGGLRWALAGTAIVLVAVAAACLALLVMVSIPDPQVSIAQASRELAPDTPITLTVPRTGAGISGVSLTESVLDPEGRVVEQRQVPLQLVPVGQTDNFSMSSDLQLRRSDGGSLLEYDRQYRLTMNVERKSLSFPLPTDVSMPQVYSFKTLTTPKVVPTQGMTELKYQKPAIVRWTSPVKDFSVEVVPDTAHRTRVDPSDRSVGYVDLIDPAPGQRYEIRVVNATGVNGAPLIASAAMAVQTAAPPKPIDGGVKLSDGDLVVIPWDRKVSGLRYQVTPEVQTSVVPDPGQPAATVIQLMGAALGQQYTVTITGGVGDNDAPLDQSYRFQVTTPPPLEITKFRPRHGSIGVEVDSPIDITFSEPIADRLEAEAAITVSPKIAGHFEWPEPNHVRFVPDEKMPLETSVTVHFASGPGALKSVRGGYMPSSDDFVFETAPRKRIDVDLTKQLLTLLDDGQPVFTTLVATGVRGAETPTGTYSVLYKMDKTRMQGVNPSGHRYDLPDVPWVMPFFEDYALHGAYWRETYGTPQSNGCVSMPTSAAKFVYDWTPVGTPVTVHY